MSSEQEETRSPFVNDEFYLLFCLRTTLNREFSLDHEYYVDPDVDNIVAAWRIERGETDCEHSLVTIQQYRVRVKRKTEGLMRGDLMPIPKHVWHNHASSVAVSMNAEQRYYLQQIAEGK